MKPRSAKGSGALLAAVSLTFLVLAAPVSAQNFPAGDGSMQVGDATISVGGGAAVLTLPDVTSMMTAGTNTLGLPVTDTFKFSDGFGDEYGWSVNGAIAIPVGDATVSLNGFWARMEADHHDTCTSAGGSGTYCVVSPIADNAAASQVFGFAGNAQMFSAARRDVDQWGAALESKWTAGGGAGLLSKERFAVGADIRGIDQDLDARFTVSNAPNDLVTYSETLDTRYYGAYLAWGGEYTPFLLAGIWESLGLVSSFRLHGGIYYADTDYDGQMTEVAGSLFDPTSSLSLSRNDVAFIGGITTETRKRIGPRTSLSLKSVYEYYSWVPEMTYNTVDGPNFDHETRQAGTRIGSDDAFSMRTSLRLNIGLGPDELYQ